MKQDSQMDLSFANLKGKTVQAHFDGGTVTSDAGALFLREVDRRTGIVDRVVGALREWRDPRYVVHELGDLVRQRIFQIALGSKDADDADMLRTDPALKAVSVCPSTARTWPASRRCRGWKITCRAPS